MITATVLKLDTRKHLFCRCDLRARLSRSSRFQSELGEIGELFHLQIVPIGFLFVLACLCKIASVDCFVAVVIVAVVAVTDGLRKQDSDLVSCKLECARATRHTLCYKADR